MHSGPVPEVRPAPSDAPPRLVRTEAVQHISSAAEENAPSVTPAFGGFNAMVGLGQAQDAAAMSKQQLSATTLEAQISELVLAGASTGTKNGLPAKLEECVYSTSISSLCACFLNVFFFFPLAM